MMTRRKKPKITGSDPEYTSATHQFTKLPTNKSGDITIKTEEQSAAQSTSVMGETEKKKHKLQRSKSGSQGKSVDSRELVVKKNVTSNSIGTRRVELLAALTPALHDKLEDIECLGIAYKDAMSLAGRRATKEFEASPVYVGKAEAERLPTAQAYRSSKSLPVSTLEKLHDEANPLRLASDGAMVRGQFEPLFWHHLESVIDELKDRYSK